MIVGGSFQTEYLKTVYELDIDPPPDLALTTLPPSLALINGLKQFYDNEEFSDVVFLLENERIFCHRLVLSTQSEWFRVLFSRGFRESTSREIPLKNVPLKVFRQMIEFFYFGGIPLLADPKLGTGNEDSDLPLSPSAAVVVEVGEDYIENSQDSEVVTVSRRSATNAAAVSNSAGEQPTSEIMSATLQAEEETLTSQVCDLLVVADQFMCEHLKERCEITLARMVNVRTLKNLLKFARTHRTELLLRCCEHFEKWGGMQM